jgi:hypothetical protein
MPLLPLPLKRDNTFKKDHQIMLQRTTISTFLILLFCMFYEQSAFAGENKHFKLLFTGNTQGQVNIKEL